MHLKSEYGKLMLFTRPIVTQRTSSNHNSESIFSDFLTKAGNLHILQPSSAL